MVMQDIRKHIFVQANFLSWYFHHVGHFLGSGGGGSSCPTKIILVDFNGSITLMCQMVAIHINSDVMIGIVSPPFNKWKNRMIMSKVW